jgi:hypothetical protein
MTGPLIIEASGTHREVGQQIGEAGRDLVAWGIDAYASRFEGLAGFGFSEAVERARGYLRVAEDYVPQAVDQLRGLAEGADVPFEQLFALNCSEEFTCRADRNWPAEHCTSFAVVAGERAVAGHNEDWYPEEIEAQTIRIVRLTGKWSSAAYISAGPAYDMPLTGITAAGFSAAANTVYYRDERVGVPNNLLLATVLGQPDLEHVKDFLARAPRARGSNHLLCDARGRVWDVETSGGRAGACGMWRRAAGAGRCWTARRRRRRPPLSGPPLWSSTPTTTFRRSSRRATPPPARARACGASAPRRSSSAGWGPATTSWRSGSGYSPTTPTRRSTSATTGRTTIRTRTRA